MTEAQLNAIRLFMRLNNLVAIDEDTGFSPVTVSAIDALDRAQKRLHALDERRCNGTEDEARYERLCDRCMKRVALLVDSWGCKPYHQTDPRGCALYLAFGDKRTDGDYTIKVAICT